MKKIILFFVLAVSIAKGQTDEQNHRKYWYYRSKLVNDFLLVGIGNGMSIPFSERGLYYNGSTNTIAATMKCGDGTSKVGVYIGVLATEYRLLKNNGQNTDKVVHELACALNALNRLDVNAETFYSGGVPSLNGFLVRDDIPKDFLVNNYAHFNYYNNSSDANGEAVGCISSPPCNLQPIISTAFIDGAGNENYGTSPVNFTTDRGFCSTVTNGMFQTQSDGGLVTGDGDEESQDQIYDMIIGLSLVSVLVDYNAHDPNIVFDGQNSLQIGARNIMTRLTNYVKDNQGSSSSTAAPWQIFNPVFDHLASYAGHTSSAQLMPWSYAVARAACFINDPVNNDLPQATPSSLPINCYQFDDHFSTDNVIGYTSWVTINAVQGSNIGIGNTGLSDAQFYVNLSAVCNCDYTNVVLKDPVTQAAIDALTWLIDNIFEIFGPPNWLIQDLNDLLGVLFFQQKVNVTGEHIYENTSVNLIVGLGGGIGEPSGLYHAPYLHSVLHGDGNRFSASQLNGTMLNLLNTAPCQGTYNYDGSNFGDMQWRSDSRIDDLERIYNDGIHFDGDFNGLDYMLYHNLYYLYNSYNKTIDLSDRKIDFTLPQNISQIDPETLPDQGSPSGTQNSPATIGAFETIIADNTVSSTADISYRAGKTIHLISSGGSQQFNVQNGAIFHAYVEPFNCNTNTSSGVYQRSTNNDTIQQQVTAYPSTNMYEQNTHGTEPIEWHIPQPVKQSTAQLSLAKKDSINNIVNTILKKTGITLPSAELFPNPSNGEFTVQNTFSYYTYTITDVVGNTILSGQMASKNTDIDLSFCQPGVYLLFINGGTGNQQTKKIIIN